MAAPSPRSHPCLPSAAQPGCAAASALSTAPSEGGGGGQGVGGCCTPPASSRGASHPPTNTSTSAAHGNTEGLRCREPLGNAPADKRLQPPPHARPAHAVPSMVTDVWLSFESLGPFTFSS